jgi:hypothetical protein
MSSVLLPVHLTSVGLWLGCVLTEALFERALLGHGRDKELILARLHKQVDLFVEIPAIVLVLLTGVALLTTAPAHSLLHVKIGFALLAIVANAYCVHLVFRREQFASSGQWDEFDAADNAQHKFGAIVLLGILMALTLGMMMVWGTWPNMMRSS